jgi:hypothetical protein
LAAPACPVDDPDDDVKVSVAAILATDRDKKVDPKLECLAHEVQKVHSNLTGFRIARATCKELEVGVPSEFTLIDGLRALVTVEHGADKNNRVSLTVRPPQMGEIAYRTACGKYFPILTRYETKDGDRLLIAIMVRSCN